MSSQSGITLDQLKSQWNLVLDALLDSDRIAWLAFFDARLISLEASKLTISFADVTKLGGDHNFSAARNPKYLSLLQEKILEITDAQITVVEE